MDIYPSHHLFFFLILYLAFLDNTFSFVFHRRCFRRSMPTTSKTPTGSGFSSTSPTSVLAFAGGEDLTNLHGKKDSVLETSAIAHRDRDCDRDCDEISVMAPMDPRSCILEVGASAGKLCCVANQMNPERAIGDGDGNCESSSELLTEALAELFASLWLTAKALRLDWVKSIRSKIALNAKKYPVEHCKGKAGKYTKYSHLTGITTENQSTMDYQEENETKLTDAIDLSLAGFAEHHLFVLAEDIRIFAEARLWAKYHKPRNLVMALLGEVGELSEILQWDKDDWELELEDGNDSDEPLPLLVDRLHSFEPERLDDLSQELADVSIYALRLATVCGVLDDLRDSLVQQKPPSDLEAKKLFV